MEKKLSSLPVQGILSRLFHSEIVNLGLLLRSNYFKILAKKLSALQPNLTLWVNSLNWRRYDGCRLKDCLGKTFQ